jgi:hypothetical protein
MSRMISLDIQLRSASRFSSPIEPKDVIRLLMENGWTFWNFSMRLL